MRVDVSAHGGAWLRNYRIGFEPARPQRLRESRCARLGALLLLAAISCGCLVGALQPVYDEASIGFDEALIGTWVNRESDVTAVVSRGEWRSYHVAYTDRFGTTRFTGHLTTVGGARFLNVRPEDGLERPAFVVALNGPLHIELDAGDDALRIRELDYATVLERLEAGKLGVHAAMDLKKNVVLTPSTNALRTWLSAAVKDSSLWADWKTFTRSHR